MAKESFSGTTKIISILSMSSGIDERVAVKRAFSLNETIIIESPGERLVFLMAIPILLLAFKRPKNTREIFNLIASDTRVYLFVDHDEKLSDLNKDVKNLANELVDKKNTLTQIQSKNLGPGKAMIQALDWAFESEEMLVVLEDDVFPNRFAASYMDSVAPRIRQNNGLIATMRSPISKVSIDDRNTSGVSKFALTNGWLLNRETWLELK